MEDKHFEEKITNKAIQGLKFTKEDRDKVLKQIHDEELKPKKKWLISMSKLAPLTATLLMVSLCIFLFFPSILQGNVFNETDINGVVSQNSGPDIKGVLSQNDEEFTALFTVKDEENRVPINLLLTYNKEKNMMNVLSIPRDTYAPILQNERTTPYDKLSHAYVNGSGGAEDVRAAVSNLFDLTIDYYAVMDLNTFSTMIDSVNGIEYDLQEDVQVRAITRVAFEFQKGTHRLNGEEVLALLMDATVGNSLDENDQLNLINAVINQTLTVLPQTQLKQFMIKSESNIPIAQLFEKKMEVPSIQLVFLMKGMINSKIGDAHYIKFEKDFLNTISKALYSFN